MELKEKRKTSEGVPGSSEGGQVGVTEDDARKRVRRFTVMSLADIKCF